MADTSNQDQYSISPEQLQKLKTMLTEDYGPLTDIQVLDIALRLLQFTEIVGKPIPEKL